MRSLREALTQRFSVCGSGPLWGLTGPVTYQIVCIADIYTTIYNSSKITVPKQQRNAFMAGHHNTRNCCFRKAENHCSILM